MVRGKFGAGMVLIAGQKLEVIIMGGILQA